MHIPWSKNQEEDESRQVIKLIMFNYCILYNYRVMSLITACACFGGRGTLGASNKKIKKTCPLSCLTPSPRSILRANSIHVILTDYLRRWECL